MSYVDNLAEADKDDFTVVENWRDYQQKNFVNSMTGITRIRSMKKLIVKSDVDLQFDKHLSTFSLSNCYFLGNLTLSGGLLGGITVENCWCDGALNLNSDVEIPSRFTLRDGGFKQIHVNGATIDYWDIERIDVAALQLFAGKFKYLNIVGSFASQTTFDKWFMNVRDMSGEVHVGEYTTIHNLSICGKLNSDSSVIIENARIGIVDLFNLRCAGLLRLRDISPVPTVSGMIHISHSNLGKAEFYNCNFKDYHSVFIAASQIVECVFLNNSWPKEISAYVWNATKEYLSQNDAESRWETIVQLLPYNGRDKLTFQKQRETYRQLKYALSRQGDSISEQRFHILEMRAYENSLEWKSAFWTKLIIKGSFWTSEFGQSFVKPVTWLLSIHLALLLFAISTNAIPSLRLSPTHPTWKGLEEGIYQYFFLINPLHKNDAQFLGATIIWDVLMRISSSYMIYNIVRATRRFIK